MKITSLLFVLLMVFSNSVFAYQLLGNFKVLSNNHATGVKGMYFNFNVGDVDRILGGTGWSSIEIVAGNHDGNKSAPAVLWRSKNGGSHSGHGRWVSNAGSDQWRVGDTVSLYAKGKIQILSVNHTDGSIGKYFNFSVDSVDRMMGNTAWAKKKFKAFGGGKIGNVVLWRTSNGGSTGNGHGRWDPSSKPGQWRVNDTIVIF